MIATRPSDFRDRFWKELPELPSGLSLDRLESLVVPQTGPGGVAVYDLVVVKAPGREVDVLLGYRQTLTPADAVRLGKKLRDAAEQMRLRERVASEPRLVMIATEAASGNVLRIFEREHVGVVDLRGTVLIDSPSLMIRFEGKRPAARQPRVPLFHGRGARVVRTLLNAPEQRLTVRALSAAVQTSYAYTFDVVYRLEQEGFVFRRSPRTGVILRDPVGLLRAWLDSGERTFAAVEPFNARSTNEAALREGLERLQAQGARCIFTLASAIPREASIVTALPHGLYSGASLSLIQEAFGLRRQTPHNFLVYRPEPAADSESGGIFASARAMPAGPAVAIPQLIVDLHSMGGRAAEQGDALLETWSRTLPLRPHE